MRNKVIVTVLHKESVTVDIGQIPIGMFKLLVRAIDDDEMNTESWTLSDLDSKFETTDVEVKDARA